MKAVAITAEGASGDILKAAYHSDKPEKFELMSRGVKRELFVDRSLESSNLYVGLSDKTGFSFSNVAWSIEAKSSRLPYSTKNARKKRLDLKISSKSNVDLDPVAPHGLIGQSYDRDDLKVIGALDEYEKAENRHVVETAAMAEGAVEGVAADYTIDRTDPFSTIFKYSRFGLTKADPRNVKSLTGKIFKKNGDNHIAGATNDEADEE